MEKSKIDYSRIEEAISPRRRVLMSEVAGRLRKVAFDVVRFVDSDNLDNLWRIEKESDGSEYIVAMYDSSYIPNKTSDWQVFSSDGHLQVFYKNSFVAKFALHDIGLSDQSVSNLYPEIENRLAHDNKFVKSLLQAVPEQSVNAFLTKFPEIVKQ